ncbi:MAG TPA: HAD family hydrolase [Candidatus Limnocylindria bacterium]|nr:HAD family hydrolase [Candidatus Limnocylindria bacterium]
MLRAALFDVGDTLVEHWATDTEARHRELLVRAFGERPWYDEWLAAGLEPEDGAALRQETLEWCRAWCRAKGVDLGVEVDALRAAMVLPLEEVSRPVPGAYDALRWCRERGLRVVLVTNTLWRGDEDCIADWRRVGLGEAITGVVSSHSVGWRKPHPAIFERALEIAECAPREAFMVGDDPVADVAGAKALGIRTVLRRTGRAGDVRGSSADAVIDDLTELPRVVAPWLGR